MKTVVVALAGALVALAIVGGFMALDRTVLHVYTDESDAGFDGTAVFRYSPPELGSVEASGDCFFGSVNSARRDALRCGKDDDEMIYDPCFSTGSDVVVCPGDPREDSDDVAFRNRAQVQTRRVERPGSIKPWFVVLETGDTCARISSRGQLAMTSVGRPVYGCSPDLACVEATPGDPTWTVDCIDDSASGRIRSLRIREVWE